MSLKVCMRLCARSTKLLRCSTLPLKSEIPLRRSFYLKHTEITRRNFLPTASDSLRYYSQSDKNPKQNQADNTIKSNEKEEKNQVDENKTLGGNEAKPSLFQRFKIMYKNYWYVLVPVHIVTSTFWFGGFYYLAKSGVDIVGILESWNVSDRIVNPLKDSSMGYLAITYACYKIATPIRYTVTLGGTTVSIKYLKQWGWIKPVPSKEQLKEIYKEKKDNILETVRETKEMYKEKKSNIMETVRDTKKELSMHREKAKCISKKQK